MARNGKRSTRGTSFPIMEAYGFPYDSSSTAAQQAWAGEACPFAGGHCEKRRQYKYGYCSVSYSADWDNGRQRPYAVCDHRLDGEPVSWAIRDYFGDKQATLIPEVTATSKPKLNIDYVAYVDDPNAPDGADLIAIETQAIDIRGGSVAPAWEAWEARDSVNWREYYTAVAALNNRPDEVNYGINTSNVGKRLGLQIASKGVCLATIDVPLYVIMQHSILQQLRQRIPFLPVDDGEAWDITFASFDYDGSIESNGQFGFTFVECVRTTMDAYIYALTNPGEVPVREEFVKRVRKKVKTPLNQSALFDVPSE